MTSKEVFRVVTTMTGPGHSAEQAHTLNEVVLTRDDLSARYPRARSFGNLILAQYDYETGIDDSEHYMEYIESATDGITLDEDPRLYDDELDPSKLPAGYQLGEGYAQWQSRINTWYWYMGVERNHPPLLYREPTLREKVADKIVGLFKS